MKQNTSRFDRLMDRLRELPGDAGDAADRPFERVSGEVLFDDLPPERDDYPETETGYRDYLADCHAKAREGYKGALASIATQSGDFTDFIEEHPEFGDVTQESNEYRREEEERAENLAETFELLAEWRETLKRIEGEIDG